MKKLIFILLAGLVLVGCSNNSNDGGKNQSENGTTETKAASKDTKDKKENDKKKEYQIGETAVITSDLYDFDYEVTVDDFKLTTEVDGTKLTDIISNADEDGRFAVVDITIKNIGDEPYVPTQMFSANLADEESEGGDTSMDEFFEEGDKELKPGKELHGHLVYLLTTHDDKYYTLKYEAMSDQETHFHLPNPEK